MPKKIAPLTDRAVVNTKPGDKARKLFDGGGLYLLINPDGKKYWRLKYRFGGSERLLALGAYPQVSLADARNQANKARRLLNAGLDPMEKRKADSEAKAAKVQADKNTFEAVALEWCGRKKAGWAEATARKAHEALTIDLIPALGKRPIAELKTPEVVAALHEIEQRSPHMADKARQYCGAIVRYAITTGKREEGKFLDLRGALKPLADSHFATFGEKDLPGFLKSLEEYKGTNQTRIALKLLMLTFVRPSELAGAQWEEFDLDAAEWRIPPERMKMRHPHIVPLSAQAVALLRELSETAKQSKSPFLFPGERHPITRHMARDTLSKALRLMGYQGMATPHGFRAMASTMLNEMGFHPDWIERQLAHKESNKIRAAYNRAQYLPERKRMMQHWADFLDGLAGTGKVLSFKKGAA